MNSTALYELIQEAKSENKAVRLLTDKERSSEKSYWKFIIEPEHDVSFKQGNVLKGDRCLIDLNFIVGAVIIPNKHERPNNPIKWSKNPYKSNPKGRRARS